MTPDEERERFEQLVRGRLDFVDFVTVQRRRKQLDDLDARIDALRGAKEELRDTPLHRMRREECLDVATLCAENGWTRRDLARFVEAFLRKEQRPPRNRRLPSMSDLANNLSKLGDAMSSA